MTKLIFIMVSLIALLSLTLVIAQDDNTAVVSGRITHDGNPISGIEVRVIYEDDQQTATTDDIGIYRVDGIPTGGWVQVFVRPDTESGFAYRNWVKESLSNTLVKDFELSAGLLLQGVFDNPDGDPLQETFWLHVEPIEMDFNLPDDEWLGVTVENGWFELMLPVGKYQLSAEPPLDSFFLPETTVNIQDEPVSNFVISLLDSPPTNTATQRPTHTPTNTATPIPTDTPKPSPSDTATQRPTHTPTSTPSNTPTATRTEPILVLGALGAVLRDAPKSGADIITRVNGQIPIIGFSPDEQYYFAEFEGQQGWISTFYGQVEGDLSNVPIIELEDQPDVGGDIPTVTVGTRGGAIRSEPNGNSQLITVNTGGMQFVILGISDDEEYYQVEFEGELGWINQRFVELIEGDLTSIVTIDTIEADNPAPKAPVEPKLEPCYVHTDQPRTVLVRVGFGENRTSVTTLLPDIDFEVLGQNVDDNDAIWYALDKEEAAAGKSVEGDVAWVIEDQIETTGDCNAVPIMEASGLIPLPPDTDGGTDELVDINAGSMTVVVPADVGWVDSGVAVTVGQIITIRASGSANTFPACWTECPGDCHKNEFCPGAIQHGPNGHFSEVLEGLGDDMSRAIQWPLYTGRFGSLVARISGNSTFEVGRSLTFTASADGTLQLRHNDPDAFMIDNTGSFTVIITVE